MANMTCSKCGTLYDSTDQATSYYFASSGGTYSRGDYASPYLIDQAAETIAYCPGCTQMSSGPLKKVTELMGGGQTQLDARGEKERETASKGKADVVHPPE